MTHLPKDPRQIYFWKDGVTDTLILTLVDTERDREVLEEKEAKPLTTMTKREELKSTNVKWVAISTIKRAKEN